MDKNEKEIAERIGRETFFVVLWLVAIPATLRGFWEIYAKLKGLPILSFWFWMVFVWLARFIVVKILRLLRPKPKLNEGTGGSATINKFMWRGKKLKSK